MDYLYLLKQVLTGYVFPESANQIIDATPGHSVRAVVRRVVVRAAAKRGMQLVKVHPFNPDLRAEGRDWPMIAYTMIGLKRLANVQCAIEACINENIPGDICECGVWRGGCAMFMRAVLKAYHVSDRVVWVVDSFEGLPKPNARRFPSDAGYDISGIDYLSVSLDQVKDNFEMFDLLDGQVRFLKGWFKDVLPSAPIKKLAVLRADGDLYESTAQILENLYDKVSPGGFIIIDDYHSWEPCKRAVMDFRAQRHIDAPIETIDWTGAYWRK